MNHIESIQKLNNRYFILRHGESESNVKHIIISDPAVGTVEFGLTDNGREMVRESLRSLGAGEFVIVSSDFLRAKQTAEIAQAFLRSDTLIFDERLRERFFGKYEGKKDDHYDIIWQNDALNPEKSFDGVEPANHLMERVTAVITDMEHKYLGKNILIVSHGDPLQFLETAFAGSSITEHQKYTLLDLGEIKEIELS
jgi:glucosyl-3-phosphoglycerate phosphatase